MYTAVPHTTAWQRFLPDGPLALLPITSDGDRSLSNVVWTNTPSEADRIAKMSDEDFAAEVNAAMRGEGLYAFDGAETNTHEEGDVAGSSSSSSGSSGGGGGGGQGGGGEGLPGDVFGGNLSLIALQKKLVSQVLRPATELAIGAAAGAYGGGGDGGESLFGGPAFEIPPEITGASGVRGAFPLATQHAGRYTLRRLALVGDAAHQVHPLGGQGVNLGLRDARLLVDSLAAAAATGADVGSATALDGYASGAAAANLPMMAALDGLQKLFATEAPLVAWARGAGLAGVNAIGPIRRQIAKYAMGGA